MNAAQPLCMITSHVAPILFSGFNETERRRDDSNSVETLAAMVTEGRGYFQTVHRCMYVFQRDVRHKVSVFTTFQLLSRVHLIPAPEEACSGGM